MSDNKHIKYFPQLYLGIKKSNTCSLGFATPHENNKAGLSRKNTVDDWLKRIYDNETVSSEIFENTVRSGFKITDSVKRHYWGGGNVVFRVLDPAGFELEIQSNNLLALINSCGIMAGGFIPGKCVWARDGAINILVHESSDVFANLINMKNLSEEALISKKDKIPGANYLTKNGKSGLYLGTVYVAEYDYDRSSPSSGSRDNACVNVNVSSRKLEEYKEYEAIRFSNSNDISLYRKIDLIKKLNHMVSDEEVTVIIQNNSNFTAANSCYPMRLAFISRNKPLSEPCITIRKISDSDINNLVIHFNKQASFIGSRNPLLTLCNIIRNKFKLSPLIVGEFNELFKYGMQYFCDSSSDLTKPITNRIHYSLLKVENNELVFWEEYNRYTYGQARASKLILPSSDEVNITDINNAVQVIDWFKSTYATAHYVYVDTPDKQNLLLPFDLS